MAINPGGSLNTVGAPTKQATAASYIDFTDSNTKGWAQQYIPDLMEKEAEVFGNRTVSGFLSQVGAEEAMAADQVVWSEQGRLHLAYGCKIKGANGNLVQITNAAGDTGLTDHGVRVGDTVVLSVVGGTPASDGRTIKAYVTNVAQDAVGTDSPNVNDKTAITVAPYLTANLGLGDGLVGRLFVYGSEYAKGQTGRDAVIEPKFESFTNKPIILKDKYMVNGSDASQIGWVEVSGEDGQNGYLWYLKAAGDTRARFSDYCEMSLIEAEKKGSSGAAAAPDGTEGLFAAIRDRGNISTKLDSLDDFDAILKEFDKQGSIEENMMFLNRDQSLAIDDMLALMNGHRGNGEGVAAGFGVFDNDANMALNLGFSGFRRGSYDFYKTDWKYLNDAQTRGGLTDAATGDTASGLGAIHGVMVPAGVSTVYDQNLGKNIKRPFLHVRYRASQTENRKMKTWTTGSVGAVTSDLDAMEMHFLSERCLVVQGANNFMLLKG